MIVFAHDHTVADGLNYIATWNVAMLMSNDLQEAMMANMGKRGRHMDGWISLLTRNTQKKPYPLQMAYPIQITITRNTA